MTDASYDEIPVVRVNYSKILRHQRCHWAAHAHGVRRLRVLQPRRPPPLWGNGYHAAAATCWRVRAKLETENFWAAGRLSEADGFEAAHDAIAEQAGPGVDVEQLARDCAQAAREACVAVAPEWRVMWLDGEPVVERKLERDLGLEETAVGWRRVVLDGVLDLGLVHRDGRQRVVDHKTTSSWPERPGETDVGAELRGVDLRDDLQTRIYAALLQGHLPPSGERTVRVATMAGHLDIEVPTPAKVEAYHLVRRAEVGRPPSRLKRGGLSRAQSVVATESQWLAAIEEEGQSVDEYRAELARARLVRWQAWAPCEATQATIDSAVRLAVEVARQIAEDEERDPSEIMRSPQPGRWYPGRDFGGLHPSSEAEAFALSGCPACDFRDLCIAEERGDHDAAALHLAADFEVRPLR